MCICLTSLRIVEGGSLPLQLGIQHVEQTGIFDTLFMRRDVREQLRLSESFRGFSHHLLDVGIVHTIRNSGIDTIDHHTTWSFCFRIDTHIYQQLNERSSCCTIIRDPIEHDLEIRRVYWDSTTFFILFRVQPPMVAHDRLVVEEPCSCCRVDQEPLQIVLHVGHLSFELLCFSGSLFGILVCHENGTKFTHRLIHTTSTIFLTTEFSGDKILTSLFDGSEFSLVNIERHLIDFGIRSQGLLQRFHQITDPLQVARHHFNDRLSGCIIERNRFVGSFQHTVTDSLFVETGDLVGDPSK